MNLKSHTEDEILAARAEGKKLFELQSNGAGEDDILIAESDETENDVLSDVLYWLSCDTEPRNADNPNALPDGWEIREIPFDEHLDFEPEEYEATN